ncbi:hypothetical protein FRB99_000872 [Tulasnella sp. 403]|nr:hypothetical protein FRB99_000872 [Tulasnella sp. 403]
MLLNALHTAFDCGFWTIYPTRETLVKCIEIEEAMRQWRAVLPSDPGRDSYAVAYGAFADEFQTFKVVFGRDMGQAAIDVFGKGGIKCLVCSLAVTTANFLANVNAIVYARSPALQAIDPVTPKVQDLLH